MDPGQTIIDAIPTIAWYARPDGWKEFLNQRWREYTGLSAEEGLGWGWKAAVHPDDLPRLTAEWESIRSRGAPGEAEARFRRADGVYRWFLFRFQPILDEAHEVVRWCGAATDIDDRKRAESLHAAEKRTLEMIADGASLRDTLDELCRSIDAQAGSVVSTILLLDAERNELWFAAGPRVPPAWLPSLRPKVIGPREGCIGAAAWFKKRVVVADVASDPIWPDVSRDLAVECGIRAAWSEPILTSDGELLGTFALYAPEPRMPTQAETDLIAGAVKIALIAIERQRSLEALKKSEAELRRITDAIPSAIAVIDVHGQMIYANQVLADYTGYRLDDLSSPVFRRIVVHPSDADRVQLEREKGMACGVPFETEFRIRRRDGKYRWFLVRYNPLRDEHGRVLHWYATATDIEERKQQEDRLSKENLALREEIAGSSMFEEIVGSSAPLRKVIAQITKVAPTDSTVLITGETGTGKELVARAIHAKSKRAAGAFVRVNCSAIPQSLIASELFGHEKGAFTGALQRRIGRFESADGGTLFLDEVGELPLETQIALLRVLQEREFERVGSNQTIQVDVRVLTASNRDLRAAVASGKFREDLFYRLNVFPIAIPSLRERADDIPLLVEYMMQRAARSAGKKIKHIDRATLDLFRAYAWPGNVRELQNVVERAVILCDGDTLVLDPTWFSVFGPQAGFPVGRITTSEREKIEAALKESKGRVAGPFGAATRLGMPRQTLDSKIAALGIDKRQFKQ